MRFPSPASPAGRSSSAIRGNESSISAAGRGGGAPSSSVVPRTQRRRDRARKCARATLLLLVMVAPPLVLDSYWLFIATQFLAFGIATLGLHILFGRAGQLSLAHGAFMGVGAYTTLLVANRGYSPLLQLLVVAVVSLVIGALVALPTLRLSGLRLALVTLAFGELFLWALTNTTETTGGTQGTAVPTMLIAGLNTSEPVDAYVFALVPAIAATLLAAHLPRTQVGRRMAAVRDSELAAKSAGIPVARTKTTAFLISSLLAGVAGWTFASVTGFIAPTDFHLFSSVYLLAVVVMGGARSVVGAWLGALYLVGAPQLFTLANQPNLYPLVGGALLTGIALLAPAGMVGLTVTARSRARAALVRTTK